MAWRSLPDSSLSFRSGGDFRTLLCFSARLSCKHEGEWNKVEVQLSGTPPQTRPRYIRGFASLENEFFEREKQIDRTPVRQDIGH